MAQPKIFICGAITGHPEYREKFAREEKFLMAIGFAVLNPAVLPDGFEHAEYMKITLAMLDVCDTIRVLPCAENSVGALEEIMRAVKTKKRFYFHTDVSLSFENDIHTLIKRKD